SSQPPAISPRPGRWGGPFFDGWRLALSILPVIRLGDLVGGGPFSCGPATTLSEPAVAMADSDLGSLAVVEGTTLLGLVTERDLRNAVARGMDLETATRSEERRVGKEWRCRGWREQR